MKTMIEHNIKLRWNYDFHWLLLLQILGYLGFDWICGLLQNVDKTLIFFLKDEPMAAICQG